MAEKFISDIEVPSDGNEVHATGAGEVSAVCRDPAPPTSSCRMPSHQSGDFMTECIGCNPHLNQPRTATPVEAAVQAWISFHLNKEAVTDLRTDLRSGLVLVSLAAKLTKSSLEPVHSSAETSFQQRIENVSLAISHFKEDMALKKGSPAIFPPYASENIAGGNLRQTIKICRAIITHYHFRFGSSTSSSFQKYLSLWLETIFPDFNSGDLNDESLIDRCKSSGGPTAVVQDSLSLIVRIEELQDSDREFIHMVYMYFFVKGSEEVLLQWVSNLPPFKGNPVRDFHNGWTDGHRLYDIVRCLLPNSSAISNLASLSANEIIEEALVMARRELSVSSHFPASAISSVGGDQFPLILLLSQLQAASIKAAEHPVDIQTSSKTEVRLISQLSDGRIYSVGKPIAIELSTPSTESGVLTACLTLPSSSDSPMKLTSTLPQPRPTSPTKVTISSRTSPVATVEWSPQHPEEKDTSALLASADEPSDADASPVQLEGVGDEADTLSSTLPAVVTVEESSSLFTVKELQPQHYRVSFTPQMEGVHHLSMLFDDEEIFPAPLSFECLQVDPTFAKQCLVRDLESTMALAKTVAVDSTLEVMVECGNAGRGTLTATVTPDLGESVSCLPLGTDGCYCVRLKPAVTGDYKLHLYWNDQSIPNSPLSIHVWDPTSSSFTVEGPGAREHAVVGWPSDFDITVPVAAAECSNSPPLVQITHNQIKLDSVQVFALNSDSEKCTYRCRYVAPEDKAELTVNVKLHGHHIGGSPFAVAVEPYTPPQSCYFQLYPEGYCFVNQPITSILDTSEASANGSHKNVHLELKYGQHTETIEPTRHKDNAHVYDVCFTPTEEGVYYLNVQFDGVPIPENGIKFKVKKTKVFVVDYPKTCILSSFITVTLNTGNATYSDVNWKNLLKANVQNEQGSSLPYFLQEGKGDLAELSCTPHTVGKHKIEVQFDGESITDVPLEIEVVFSSLPELSVKDFTDNGDQCLVSVCLHMKDATLEGFKKPAHLSQDDGSTYNAQAVGKQTENMLYPVKLSCVQDGEFNFTFSTKVPDTYLLSIYHYDQLLPCCPFPLDIASHVIYYDPVVPFEVGPSNAIEFVLDTSESPTTDQNLKVQVSPSASYEDLCIVEEAPELFRVSFKPKKDDEFSVQISWFCLPITTSPITIPFMQRATKPLINVSFEPHMGPRVSLAAKLVDKTNGKEHELPVATNNGSSTNGGDTSSLAKEQGDKQGSNSLSSPPKLALQQFKRGRYEMWFRDYERGRYCLHVYCLGQELKGSPFAIDTTGKAPAKPPRKRGKMQVVKIKNQKLGCGEMGILAATVTGREVGPVKLSLTVTENNSMAVVQFNDKDPHDIYDLRLYWNYREFKGSPFELAKHYESAHKNDIQ